MANPKHLKILLQGVEAWNKWRKENPEIMPNLSCANLEGLDLTNVNFKNTILSHVNLKGVKLKGANLEGADLTGSNILESNLEGVDLREIILIIQKQTQDELKRLQVEDVRSNGGRLASNANIDRGEKEEPIRSRKVPITKKEHYKKKEKRINWKRSIEDEIEKLAFGQVLFCIPNLMKIGKKERIEIRISKDLYSDITKKLKGKGKPEIEISKVGDFMKVRLSGDHFKINALNEEEQIVAEDTYTEWAWDVMPLKSKIQLLHFHVTVRLKIEGSEEKRDYPVIDKEVYVKVSTVYSTKVFIGNNWKWILTALLIPLAGWIVRMFLVRGK